MSTGPGNYENEKNEKPRRLKNGAQIGNPQQGNVHLSDIVITSRTEVINEQIIDENGVTWSYTGKKAVMRSKDKYGRVDQKSARDIYLDDNGWEKIT